MREKNLIFFIRFRNFIAFECTGKWVLTVVHKKNVFFYSSNHWKWQLVQRMLHVRRPVNKNKLLTTNNKHNKRAHILRPKAWLVQGHFKLRNPSRRTWIIDSLTHLSSLISSARDFNDATSAIFPIISISMSFTSRKSLIYRWSSYYVKWKNARCKHCGAIVWGVRLATRPVLTCVTKNELAQNWIKLIINYL